MQKITIERTTAPKAKPTDETKLGFGKIFTDHMFIMNYDEGEGWHNPRIVPYAPIALDPAAMCLHYGQADFEDSRHTEEPTAASAFSAPIRIWRDSMSPMTVSASRR